MYRRLNYVLLYFVKYKIYGEVFQIKIVYLMSSIFFLICLYVAQERIATVKK
jgi:hypothetical protein